MSMFSKTQQLRQAAVRAWPTALDKSSAKTTLTFGRASILVGTCLPQRSCLPGIAT
jgi:hypothetical protein